jgi:type IV fimbrial biogenesis protein FimT
MHKGLSLVELIIALCLGAIIVVFALPGFQKIIQNNRAQQLTADVEDALRYARSEAIRRGEAVSICAADNSDYSRCGADWANGWIIFPNPNEDTIFNNNEDEPALRIHRALSSGRVITVSPTQSLITFNRRGFPDSSSTALQLTISTTGCSGPNTSLLTIEPTGLLTRVLQHCPH